MRKNYELELYKLLINPEEDDIDISYVDEFGWVSNTEFYVQDLISTEYMDKRVLILYPYGLSNEPILKDNIPKMTKVIR